MSPACAQWATLSDRKALGDALSEAESEWLRKHATRCDRCAAERATWDALGSLLEGDEPLIEIERIRPRARHWRRDVAMFASGFAAVAVLGVLVLTRPWGNAENRINNHASVQPPAALARVARPSSLRVASTTGACDVDGTAASVEQAVRVGARVSARSGVSCLALPPGVLACLSEGSSVRVVEADRARRLELVSGRLTAELEPQPPGASFAVLTRDGSATAVGTVFAVEIPEGGGPSQTRVLHGTVLVRSSFGVELRVTAQHVGSMDGTLRALEPAEETRDRALLSNDDAIKAPAAALDEPAAATVQGPASPRPRAARRSESTIPRESTERSATALLKHARERAAAGDADASLAAYRSLFERYPSSPEAHAARVPYGEILLGLRPDPEAALEAFDRYLAKDGPLAEEACYGRIRALRALHRASEERAARVEFVRRFPSSALARPLRARVSDPGTASASEHFSAPQHPATPRTP
ncbi:MAG TPA: FecR domain-containing protein [Polyangiales bacterium]|nr:FecR domain-containing protein [Polyangiales bacterium]